MLGNIGRCVLYLNKGEADKSQVGNTSMGGKALAADVTNAGGIIIINCAYT